MDLVIVDRHSIAMQTPEKHVRILFGLKKLIIKANTLQIMTELIAVDLKSKYTVLAVLTDLMDDWRLYWLRDKKIIGLKLERVNAVALLRKNIELAERELEQLGKQASGQASSQLHGHQESDLSIMSIGTVSEPGSPTSEVEPVPKRQKFRHIVGSSNISIDVAPMEDFFDTMSEDEIFKYKAKHILTRFFSQPIFYELNDHQSISPLLPLQADTKKRADM